MVVVALRVHHGRLSHPQVCPYHGAPGPLLHQLSGSQVWSPLLRHPERAAWTHPRVSQLGLWAGEQAPRDAILETADLGCVVSCPRAPILA